MCDEDVNLISKLRKQFKKYGNFRVVTYLEYFWSILGHRILKQKSWSMTILAYKSSYPICCGLTSIKQSAMASSSIYLLFVLSSLLIYSRLSEAESSVPLVKGLSYTFHHSSCPRVEIIIRKHLKKVFKEDIGQAAGLLRLHFHDCFVQVNN